MYRYALVAGLLMALPRLMTAQQAPAQSDSVESQIRGVLRAFYMHLEHRNWDALSPYVLSPKLLERRGDAGDAHASTKDRTRGRDSSHAASRPKACPASPSARIDDASIRIDGDWAEVSVPRCRGDSGGVDELRMLYFEERWRFIYTDLFDGSPSAPK